MGYGEFGGGGSVKWTLDCDDAPEGGGRRRVNETGRDDQNPETFTVTVAYKDAATARAAWAAIRRALPAAGNRTARRIVFTIPFEDHANHKIKVNWP
jgi:hypothetical protein